MNERNVGRVDIVMWCRMLSSRACSMAGGESRVLRGYSPLFDG